jgi:heat shock protein HtpX
MKRLALFLATNLAVVLVLGVVVELSGIRDVLDAQGQGIGYYGLLVMAAIVGMTGSFISLAMSKRMALMTTGAHVIERPANRAEAWLVDTVRRQAQAAGIGMPDVAVYDAPDVNAFATGMDRDHALVAVSTGLLRQMDQDQAEAVLGHEVSHVANGDMVTLTLIQGVVNTFVFFLSRVIGVLVDRAVFRVERGHGPGYWITVLIAQMVLGILASIIVMWFSRQREFRADRGGATLAGREKMISALQALQRATQPAALPDQLAAFGISAGSAGGWRSLFLTHPPLEERIAALQGWRGPA